LLSGSIASDTYKAVDSLRAPIHYMPFTRRHTLITYKKGRENPAV
jgi:hypothetical protein